MTEKMKIYTYPDSVLRTNAKLVENIDGDTQSLIDNMAKTMYSAPGIGLAAVQVGEPLRVIMYDIEYKDNKQNPRLCHPKVLLSMKKLV